MVHVLRSGTARGPEGEQDDDAKDESGRRLTTAAAAPTEGCGRWDRGRRRCRDRGGGWRNSGREAIEAIRLVERRLVRLGNALRPVGIRQDKVARATLVSGRIRAIVRDDLIWRGGNTMLLALSIRIRDPLQHLRLRI